MCIVDFQQKIPILAVSLELYDDNTKTANATVKKVQWFDETSGVGKNVRGKRVLIVDEVDDTRTTLAYCVDEIKKTNEPSAIAVAVVHNKLKQKKTELPSDVTYFAGENVPDKWNCYPWDSRAYDHSIVEHEEIANKCANNNSSFIKNNSNIVSFIAGIIITTIVLTIAKKK